MSPRSHADFAKNLADIEAVLDVRFQDARDGRFGISRMGEPYSSHSNVYSAINTMRAKTSLEKALVKSLQDQKIEAAVYTAPVAPSVGKEVRIRPFAGPVLMAMNYRDINLPNISSGEPDFLKIVQKAQAGKVEPVGYRGWTIYPRGIKATTECISCHETREHHKVSVGDVVGYVLVVMRHGSGSETARN